MDASKDSTLRASWRGGSAEGLLKEAQGLAVRVDALIEQALDRPHEGHDFRVRLARAHALGLLDQLAELVGPVRSGPGLRDCTVPEPVESSVQPKLAEPTTTAWRSG